MSAQASNDGNTCTNKDKVVKTSHEVFNQSNETVADFICLHNKS